MTRMVCDYIEVYADGHRDQFVEAMDNALKRLPEGAMNPTFEIVKSEDAYSDHVSAELHLCFQRPETDAERFKREAHEDLSEQRAREQYEALKKRFGG